MQAQEHAMLKTLRAEHKHMGNVLKLLVEQVDLLEEGSAVDCHVLYEVMDYVTTWPDRFHHPREDIIYARVAEIDVQAADDVDTLQRDHDVTARRGQSLLEAISAWQQGEVSDKKLIKAAREYVAHVYDHMAVEEQVVFPRIQAVLTEEDWRDLVADDSIRAVNKPLFGVPVQREYLKLARKLRRATRRSVETAVLGQMVGIESTLQSLEVLSSAYAETRQSAAKHFDEAYADTRNYMRDSLVTAPARSALNGIRHSLEFLKDFSSIRDAASRDFEEIASDHREQVDFVKKSRNPGPDRA